MKKILFYLLLLCTANNLLAQVQIQVDIMSGRKVISPYIYGRNNSLSDDPANPVTAANWQLYKDAGVNFFRENGGK